VFNAPRSDTVSDELQQLYSPRTRPGTLLKKKQEDDAEEVENLEEIEGMLMRELSDTFHAVYKNHPVRFTNVFKPVANQLSRFIVRSHEFSFCIFIYFYCVCIDTGRTANFFPACERNLRL